MDTAPNKTVALIGAGPSSLVCARWLLYYKLKPTLFEKCDDIGGLWRPKSGIVWPSMTTNISKYHSFFFGLEHESPNAFQTTSEMYNYLRAYADKFGIIPYIRFRHEIVQATKESGDAIRNSAWRIQFRDLTDSATLREEQFDFLVITSGTISKPYIPELFRSLLSSDSNCFKGSVYHSIQFPQLFPFQNVNPASTPPVFAGKQVLLVGGSFSAAEVLSDLLDQKDATHNATRVHWLMRRPRWFYNKWVSSVLGDKSSLLVPNDLRITRRNRTSPHEVILTTEEQWRTENLRIQKSCIEQQQDTFLGGRLRVNEQFFTRPPLKLLTGNFEHFRDQRKAEKLNVFVGEKLLRFEERAAVFESGIRIECDAVIFCTGYSTNLREFLDARVLQEMEYDPSDTRVAGVFYKLTFCPAIANLAFIAMHRGTHFYISELQARWISLVFSGRLAPPDPQELHVRAALDAERALIHSAADAERSCYLHTDYVGVGDDLAREFGAMPDMERLHVEDPELHALLVNGTVLAYHYFLDGPAAEPQMARDAIVRLNREIKDLFLNK